MTDDERRHVAEVYALESDSNLEMLIAWRVVVQRAAAGGFNGLLATDLIDAHAGLQDTLAKAKERLS